MGSIIGFLVCVWFFMAAKNTQKNQLLWAAIGFVTFFATARLWHYLVIGPTLVHNTRSAFATMIIISTPTIAALIVSSVVWFFLLRKPK